MAMMSSQSLYDPLLVIVKLSGWKEKGRETLIRETSNKIDQEEDIALFLLLEISSSRQLPSLPSTMKEVNILNASL